MSIPIKNIHYMLSYAFRVLNRREYEIAGVENFENALELYSAILLKGVAELLKKGLGKEYILHAESLSAPRGKINVSDSIKTQSLLKKQLVCNYDIFSVNSYKNRIIKTTMCRLIKSDISFERKKEIQEMLMFFGDVEILDAKNINWYFQYDRNNESYRTLMAICQFILMSLLENYEAGNKRIMRYFDEQSMPRLYEKFILEYYRRHYPMLNPRVSKIDWQIDDNRTEMLPDMKTDIMLSYKNSTLIIDAKYYSHSTQAQFGSHKLHSHNLYQIFTYVKNKAYEIQKKSDSIDSVVSGLLLYAKTDEVVIPYNNQYQMSGNKIGADSLNLNCDFEEIKEQMHKIIVNNFGNIEPIK